MLWKLPKSIAAALVTVSLSACGGGLCPMDIPDCCSNVVFGCGPFELPFGCSCSDYGYPFTAQAKRVTVSAPTVGSGDVWSGTLKRHSSSCPGLPHVIKGKVKVVTSSHGVHISVPGYGNLHGQRRKNRYIASGAYSPFEACIGIARVKLSANQSGKARTSVAINYSCNGKRVCSAQYGGNLQSGF